MGNKLKAFFSTIGLIFGFLGFCILYEMYPEIIKWILFIGVGIVLFIILFIVFLAIYEGEI